MIIVNMILGFILFIVICAIYIIIVNCVSIALSKLNFYMYKRKTNKYLDVATQGNIYRQEFLKWFEVESKMYKLRDEKIDRLYNKLLLKERER